MSQRPDKKVKIQELNQLKTTQNLASDVITEIDGTEAARIKK